MKLLLSVIVIALFASVASGQVPNYPQNYFRWPLNLRPEIVANMGELRSNHWHMGLDMRTNQQVNHQVFAAAEGYIAYIGIRPLSFGRFIIINHPNGLSTLYAHLNDFAPEIERFITDYQYQQRSWATELTLDPGRFPVTKGAFIAYSGTTGGSQGPHVHFEIRETSTGKCLNPLMFGFPLADDVRPVFQKLAIYDRTQSIYASPPRTITTKNTDSGYIVPGTPVVRTRLSKLSFGIQAFDRMTGSTNQDGIYSASLYVDGKHITGFVIDSISYDETGYMNAHIDYPTRIGGGAYIQHLSKMPGDRTRIYRGEGDGVIELADTLPRAVRIEIRDAAQNISVLNFILQREQEVAVAKRTFPEGIIIPGHPVHLHLKDFELDATSIAVYDTVNLQYDRLEAMPAGAISYAHVVNSTLIPVHDTVQVRLLVNRPLTTAEQGKIIIQRISGKGKSTRAARHDRGWAVAPFGDFGKYQAFIDQTPPTINGLGKGDTVNLSPVNRIVFTPTDNFGIAGFSAELNGQWLRFTNDKGRSWIYEFDERCPYGVHELKVTVTDLAGNAITKSWWFKRYPYTPPPKKKVTKKKKTGTKAKTPVRKKK